MEEQQYLDIIKKIVNGTNNMRTTRNGARTMALFGEKMTFTLKDNILPIFTTKRVFFRGVVEELLWFIRGSTDANELKAKGVHIWDGHSSRAHLDNMGLTKNEEGDCGPIYGFQLRHCGANYTNCHDDYKGKGKDQLKSLIDGIKLDPYGRRHVISMWNVNDLHRMALPPCHMACQFFVDNENYLHCMMYQRSGDVGLGVPFNVVSYSILTRLIAAVAGLKAGSFQHVLGDTHIYEEHVEPLKIQCQREPYPFPKLKIKGESELRSLEDVEKLCFDDFILDGYKCHPTIKMDMVV